MPVHVGVVHCSSRPSPERLPRLVSALLALSPDTAATATATATATAVRGIVIAARISSLVHKVDAKPISAVVVSAIALRIADSVVVVVAVPVVLAAVDVAIAAAADAVVESPGSFTGRGRCTRAAACMRGGGRYVLICCSPFSFGH